MTIYSNNNDKPKYVTCLLSNHMRMGSKNHFIVKILFFAFNYTYDAILNNVTRNILLDQ